MENLNSAIKRIENKGKKSVDPKKNEITEVRRNVRNPKYRNTDGSFNKKLYDQDGNKKTQGYMSTIDDGADKDGKIRDTRSMSGHPDNLRQKKKEEDARDKKVQDTAQDLKKKTVGAIKKTGQVAVRGAKLAARKTKDGVRSYTGAFGTSSFNKESKITFKDYLNKL